MFTVESIQTWYPTIEKPAFAPSDSVLVPVWIILYVPMGIAAFLVWRKGLERRIVKIALVIFSAQLILNVIWLVVFFGLRSLHYGMLVIIALWLMILLSQLMFFKISRTSGLFMLPYFIWVSYAAILNVSIWALQFS
jgi:tryptophan-rich sensory protein